MAEDASVQLLGRQAELAWRQTDGGVTVTLPTDLADAGQALRRGDVVLIPTDTVYGLAAAAANTAAVDAMFALKQRPADVRVAVTDQDAEALAETIRKKVGTFFV